MECVQIPFSRLNSLKCKVRESRATYIRWQKDAGSPCPSAERVRSPRDGGGRSVGSTLVGLFSPLSPSLQGQCLNTGANTSPTTVVTHVNMQREQGPRASFFPTYTSAITWSPWHLLSLLHPALHPHILTAVRGQGSWARA